MNQTFAEISPPVVERQSSECLSRKLEALRRSLNSALCGKADVIEIVIAAMLSQGHILLEDLPGLGKTTLAKALAQSVEGKFARVQCTPDLLPSDVTGFNVFNQSSRQFDFIAGPVFSDVLLADEINRAAPRTQSALLEAMSERQVTIDNRTYPLADSFLVIATQNPVESAGAYPLPKAQLDRFAVKIRVGYPNRDAELEMLAKHVGEKTSRRQTVAHVMSLEDLGELQRQVAAVAVSDPLRQYLVDLASATRNHPEVSMGVSPRGLLIWMRIAQAWAFLDGRDFVTPDDVKKVAEPVLKVRLACSGDSQAEVIDETLRSVAVPVFSAHS